jgi:hypothetical protein
MPTPNVKIPKGLAYSSLLRGLYPARESDPGAGALLRIAKDLRRCLPTHPRKNDECAAVEEFDRLLGPSQKPARVEV